MNSRQIWIVAGTAVVSFALGVAAATSLQRPETASVAAIRQTKSKGRNASAIESGDAEVFPGKTRVGKRDDKKKTVEPRISIPLNNIAKLARQDLQGFKYLEYSMDRVLQLFGASEQERSDIKALVKRTEAEIYAQEKLHLKVIQTDETQLRMDNSSMESPSKSIVKRTQDEIRSLMPADLAEVLISTVQWDRFYPTDEKSYPTLHITRSTSGKMTALINEASSGTGYPVDSKFVDDGTPLPADQVFQEDRWKPFLKGLTLLPQNEK